MNSHKSDRTVTWISMLLTIFFSATSFANTGGNYPTTEEGQFVRGVEPLKENEIRRQLEIQGISKPAIAGVIQALRTVSHTGKYEDLAVGGYLFTRGWNGSFYIDNDDWKFDAVFRAEGRTVSVEDAITASVYKGGIRGVAGTYGYEWVFVFLPPDVSFATLSGATCGRGLALGAQSGFVGRGSLGVPLGGGIAAGRVKCNFAQDGIRHRVLWYINLTAGAVSGVPTWTELGVAASILNFATIQFPKFMFKKLQPLETGGDRTIDQLNTLLQPHPYHHR